MEPSPRFCSVKLPWGLLLSTLGSLQRPSTVFSLCLSDCTLNLKVKIQFLQLPPVFLLHMVFNGVCSILQYDFHDDLGAKDFPGRQVAGSVIQAREESFFEEVAQMWMNSLGNFWSNRAWRGSARTMVLAL